ncbi:MAG TPA: FAD-dependent oxidoreductase, partial [Spirochaetia bacterium]|nr:FAD-dependent oxidoreductase [Spirochaetia bacterium]
MKRISTEILVIGGGPAGTPLAMALANAGKSVVLVESGPGLGGTCLFHGCIPSKIFRESAVIRNLMSLSANFGVLGSSDAIPVMWDAVQRRRGSILGRRAAAALSASRHIPGLTVIFGFASFSNPYTVLVDSSEEGVEISFEQAAIATGSSSRRLAVEG